MEEADWDALKEMMTMPWGSMKLQCDEYELTLCQELDGKRKRWATMVYVNGVFNGKWSAAEDNKPTHEEARRFLRPVTSALYSKKEIEATRKVWGKREANRLTERRWTYFSPVWTNFNSLRKHLVSNNTSVSRVLH